jgi:hypothetical protein
MTPMTEHQKIIFKQGADIASQGQPETAHYRHISDPLRLIWLAGYNSVKKVN